MSPGVRNILAADIGGTNSRFGHFTVEREGGPALQNTKWLKTGEAGSFRDLLDNLAAGGMSLQVSEADIVVIAIAGPVEGGIRSAPPLIPWGVDISNAREDFGFKRCALINDFVAQAYACLTRVGREADRVLPGSAMPESALAVTGAGTGFGQAALVPDGRGGYVAMPSEAGHANFPFVSREEFGFQEFLLKERGDRYITVNTVVSGNGLSYLHEFLTGEKLAPHEVSERFSKHPDTLEWASRFYARACRNYALQTLALGGLYIAGGVAAREPQVVTHEAFKEEFRSSDTLGALLERIPVFLIKDRNSGLWGAAMCGIHLLNQS